MTNPTADDTTPPPIAVFGRHRLDALIAALAAGAAGAAAWGWSASRAPVAFDDGVLVARGALARGIDAGLAGTPDVASPVAIGLTFRDAENRVCRSFAQGGDIALAGLACRDDGRWTLPVVARAAPTAAAELRQAAAAVPPEVQAAIDARLQGDVFDAAQEREARARGWD